MSEEKNDTVTTTEPAVGHGDDAEVVRLRQQVAELVCLLTAIWLDGYCLHGKEGPNVVQQRVTELLTKHGVVFNRAR